MARIESPDEPRAGKAGTQSPAKFAKHLDGVAWPATKEDLLEKARSDAAPDEVLRGIERLPGARFASREDVLVAYESAWQHRGDRSAEP